MENQSPTSYGNKLSWTKKERKKESLPPYLRYSSHSFTKYFRKYICEVSSPTLKYFIIKNFDKLITILNLFIVPCSLINFNSTEEFDNSYESMNTYKYNRVKYTMHTYTILYHTPTSYLNQLQEYQSKTHTFSFFPYLVCHIYLMILVRFMT